MEIPSHLNLNTTSKNQNIYNNRSDIIDAILQKRNKETNAVTPQFIPSLKKQANSSTVHLISLSKTQTAYDDHKSAQDSQSVKEN